MKTMVIAVLLLLTACKNEQKETSKNTTEMVTMEQTKMEKDRAEIQSLVETLFSETDNRNWEAVMNTMADSVYTDYTALGGDAGFKSPKTIVDGWQQLLPGFERTVHNPHNFAIWVAGDRATSTLDAIATHYLEGEYWTVFVGYDTEFIQKDGAWKLARIDLSLYDQAGDQGLPQKALENVQNGNIPSLQEAQNITPIESFFNGLENRNLEDVLAPLAENVVQEMPFAPSNFPKTLNGIEAMRSQYSGVMEYNQTYERSYFGTADPNVILVKFSGTITTGEGKPYNNSYVGMYTISEDGKIEKFVEQFNPNILLNGWPGLQPETYSMHEAGASTDSGVKLQNVTFDSEGILLKGHLFLPPNFDAEKRYPAAIVTGSWTSVKEQMPDEYASILAKDGFITLTFDFTGFGESEGQPRQVEDYELKIQDIKSAITFLTNHENVNATEISGLGVCASSGYMAHATAQDSRINKLILVAPWLHNPEIAKSIYDMRPGGTEGLLKAAGDAKKKYAETGEMEYVLAASELDPLSAMYVPENAFGLLPKPGQSCRCRLR